MNLVFISCFCSHIQDSPAESISPSLFDKENRFSPLTVTRTLCRERRNSNQCMLQNCNMHWLQSVWQSASLQFKPKADCYYHNAFSSCMIPRPATYPPPTPFQPPAKFNTQPRSHFIKYDPFKDLFLYSHFFGQRFFCCQREKSKVASKPPLI